MRYVADIFYLDERGHHSLEATELEAESDSDAGRQAQVWAIPILAQMIGSVTHLLVTRDAVGVFSKSYGEL